MTSENPSPLRFVLIGAGRVGTAVSLLLEKSEAAGVGVSSRTPDSANRAASLLRTEVFDHHRELPHSDAVLIGAGDRGIAEIAEAMAPHVTEDLYVIHFAGSLGTEILEPVARRGARALALHPVQACPSVEAGLKRLPGSVWGATCADEELEWATRLVQRLEGRVVRVDEQDRGVWHAASVSVSNGIAALMSVGEDMLAAIGIDSAHEVLGPLAAGTVANAREGGGGGPTLTGPVVRNELESLNRHLEALRRVDERLADEYVNVAMAIVRAAVRSRRLDEDAADLMSKELLS